MVQSINTQVEITAKANSFHRGLGSTFGNILVGNKGFEFFNERNVNDFIQIPWEEVEVVLVQVLFGGKSIRGFAIHTKRSGHFTFTAKDSGRILKLISKHIGMEKILKARSLWRKIQLQVQSRRKKEK